jgi:hypothetical protein
MDKEIVAKLCTMPDVLALIQDNPAGLCTTYVTWLAKKPSAAQIAKKRHQIRRARPNVLLKTCLLCILADGETVCIKNSISCARKCDFAAAKPMILAAPNLHEFNKLYNRDHGAHGCGMTINNYDPSYYWSHKGPLKFMSHRDCICMCLVCKQSSEAARNGSLASE